MIYCVVDEPKNHNTAGHRYAGSTLGTTVDATAICAAAALGLDFKTTGVPHCYRKSINYFGCCSLHVYLQDRSYADVYAWQSINSSLLAVKRVFHLDLPVQTVIMLNNMYNDGCRCCLRPEQKRPSNGAAWFQEIEMNLLWKENTCIASKLYSSPQRRATILWLLFFRIHFLPQLNSISVVDVLFYYHWLRG